MGPSTSSMSAEVAVAALAMTVGAAMVMMRTAVTAVMATVVVVVMVALGALWWRGFHGGVYTKSRVHDLGLSSQSLDTRVQSQVTVITSKSWRLVIK